MFSHMIFFADLLCQLICLFCFKRYVFLEYGLEPKKQRLYFLGSVLLSLLCGAFDENVAMILVVFLSGLNISLARKSHRVSGFFLVIPIAGIANGLVIPILSMSTVLFSQSDIAVAVYRLIMDILISALLLLFSAYYEKKQREKQIKMEIRHLRKWELGLLCFVGILMMGFSNIVSISSEVSENAEGISGGAAGKLVENNLFMGVFAFTLAITIIVLVVQGNKRSFYHERVSRMQSGMITFMAEVVENRDDNTGGHIRRTAQYVELIAKELKRKEIYRDILTDKYVADMVVAAPLHDIGKIHIPDAVLNKPGKLTEEEFNIMKAHTTAGEELLEHAKEELGESSYLNTALEMAAYHHEWWNGKGYPYGISGDEIPICARIMAVADVFDALTSKRCYKNAMPLEKAYQIIREESGTHFDPQVVDAFFAAMERFDGGTYEKLI